MFAAILICGLMVSSCKKDPAPEPEPTTQTVLAGIVAIGYPVYDSVTYSFEYDAQYRLVRSKAVFTNSNEVIKDFRFTYSEGHLSVNGLTEGNPQVYECTLDSVGNITHIDETSVLNDTMTIYRTYDYTYNAEGRMMSEFIISDDSSTGTTQIFTWEGDEIRSVSTSEGFIVLDYETSDAPAQALLHLLGYNIELSELCLQGCFGSLPAHMPSKRTMTTTLPIPGMDPFVWTNNYAYTLNAEGRLATLVDTGDSHGETTSYTFIWEER